MLQFILIASLLAVVALLLYAASRPDQFSVARSLRINAPADRVFGLIVNMFNAQRWNAFMKKDPAVKLSFSGPESGPGATCDFAGNNAVGAGRIAITSVAVPTEVVMKLDMLKPMKTSNTVVFTLAPEADGTQVTWAMHGEQPYLGKLMGVLFNMDKLVGGGFDQGLVELKALAEAP
jgi:hypothetical protein